MANLDEQWRANNDDSFRARPTVAQQLAAKRKADRKAFEGFRASVVFLVRAVGNVVEASDAVEGRRPTGPALLRTEPLGSR